MRTKTLLAVTLLTMAASSNALTLEESRGMVYAHCAGVYMAASSVAFEKNHTDEYDATSRLLSQASDAATVRIGDSKTTDIAEYSVTSLLNSYRRNPILGEDKIARARSECAKYFE